MYICKYKIHKKWAPVSLVVLLLSATRSQKSFSGRISDRKTITLEEQG